MELETKQEDMIPFEKHNKYIDIHLILNGKERIDYSESEEVYKIQDYDECNDYELYECFENRKSFYLDDEHCVIFFPNELHKPCIRNGTSNIIKIVVKILYGGKIDE